MFQEERINAIMEHLNQHERIDIKDICQQFEVSRDTARRDLLKMEELGLIHPYARRSRFTEKNKGNLRV